MIAAVILFGPVAADGALPASERLGDCVGAGDAHATTVATIAQINNAFEALIYPPDAMDGADCSHPLM
jgi:hypothetical protein